MTLFFSRRTFNESTKRFTNNPSALTRYVEISQTSITVNKGHIIDKDTWKAKVLAQAEAPELVIFVHGFNTDQSEMLHRQRKIEAGLRANGYRGAVIAYDWPSDGSVHSYNSDREDAKTVASFLVTEGIALFLNETPRLKIHIIAHSMGCYLTLRGFSGTGDAPGVQPWRVDQFLAVSGDVDAAWMGSGVWGSLVTDLRTKRFTNYYAPTDRVLKLSKFINGMKSRLGRAGLPDLVPIDHFDVRCAEQYLDKVDANDQSMRFSHNWYFDDAGFLEDAARTIAGEAADQMPTRETRAHLVNPILMT